MNGKQRPGWYFAHAEDELNLRILSILRMFDDASRGPRIGSSELIYHTCLLHNS